MFKKVAALRGEFKDKAEILNFIIESNKAALKQQKELMSVVYTENGAEWELFFYDNESHEAKVAFWDEALTYIRQNHITRFFIAGDYKMTDLTTNKVTEALIVTYCDQNLVVEQYEIAYKRKLFKGIVFSDTEKKTHIEMPYLESIFDFWENGNTNIDKGLKRYPLAAGFKIYFPKEWLSETDPEDGHDVFLPKSQNPVVHISVITPVKNDGGTSTDEELAQYAKPKEYRKIREDLQFAGDAFTLNFYELPEITENGKPTQSLLCYAVFNGHVLYATIVADTLGDCEQAVPYLTTLTYKKA